MLVVAGSLSMPTSLARLTTMTEISQWRPLSVSRDTDWVTWLEPRLINGLVETNYIAQAVDIFFGPNADTKQLTKTTNYYLHHSQTACSVSVSV